MNQWVSLFKIISFNWGLLPIYCYYFRGLPPIIIIKKDLKEKIIKSLSTLLNSTLLSLALLGCGAEEKDDTVIILPLI